jgi:arginyl-tRNA synthetase
MNIFNEFEKEIKAVIAQMGNDGALPQAMDVSKITVESPRDASHGDLATNAAMVLTKQAGMNPRQLAEILKQGIETVEGVDSVEIAGPGFINIRLNAGIYLKLLNQILDTGLGYGSSNIGQNKPVNV